MTPQLVGIEAAMYTRLRAIVLVLGVLQIMPGCATQPAPQFGGRWQPLNRFPDAPQTIPLRRAYEFYASPLDVTLKAMLERWAKDTTMTLSYRLALDYTLFGGVEGLRTGNLEEAVSRLSELYAPQGLIVSVEGGQIVVQELTTANRAAELGR